MRYWITEFLLTDSRILECIAYFAFGLYILWPLACWNHYSWRMRMCFPPHPPPAPIFYIPILGHDPVIALKIGDYFALFANSMQSHCATQFVDYRLRVWPSNAIFAPNSQEEWRRNAENHPASIFSKKTQSSPFSRLTSARTWLTLLTFPEKAYISHYVLDKGEKEINKRTFSLI